MMRYTEANKSVPSIPPQTVAAGTLNGSLGGTSGWIDTAGFGEATLKVQFGTVADTITDIDIKLYEADDVAGTGAAAISDAEEVDLAGANVDNLLRQINVRLGGAAAGSRKRYIRPTIVSAPTGDMAVSAEIVLSQAQVQPVTQATAAVQVD